MKRAHVKERQPHRVRRARPHTHTHITKCAYWWMRARLPARPKASGRVKQITRGCSAQRRDKEREGDECVKLRRREETNVRTVNRYCTEQQRHDRKRRKAAIRGPKIPQTLFPSSWLWRISKNTTKSHHNTQQRYPRSNHQPSEK